VRKWDDSSQQAPFGSDANGMIWGENPPANPKQKKQAGNFLALPSLSALSSVHPSTLTDRLTDWAPTGH
jgi:hypothetical protein